MAPVLLLEPDRDRLLQLGTGLRRAGFDVTEAASIAEIERWPRGMLVVADGHHFTPWWSQVGAAGSVVLAHTQEQGRQARRNGATAWVFRHCTPAALLQAVHWTVGSSRLR